MVIVQLMGGLGNQMFQYALGRCLALRRKEPLFLYLPELSIKAPDTQEARQYGLDAFCIDGENVTTRELRGSGSGVIWTITETGFGHFPEVLADAHLHRHLGLIGWWQSEKYFKEIEGTIRIDFRLKDSYLPQDVGPIREKMAGTDSVCIHIRRTDYMEETDSRGFLGLSYYEEAVEFLRNRLSNPHLFVFSDDIEWCKSATTFTLPATFVSPANPSSQHAVEDLYRMSLCKHFVIANSTYSWWGAWLATYPEKLVVAPKRWFRIETTSSNDNSLSADDLIPETWFRL